MDVVWISLACAAGGCIALQAATNASLRLHLDDPRYAAFFSICGTIATAAMFMLAVRPAPPSAAVMRTVPWWNWLGGPLGALIVLSGAALTPKLGAAVFSAAFVGGQLVCSLALDHYGLLNLPRQDLTPGRMLGAGLVFAGVLLVRYS